MWGQLTGWLVNGSKDFAGIAINQNGQKAMNWTTSKEAQRKELWNSFWLVWPLKKKQDSFSLTQLIVDNLAPTSSHQNGSQMLHGDRCPSLQRICPESQKELGDCIKMQIGTNSLGPIHILGGQAE